MKSLFEGIGSLFTDFLLAPYDLLRNLELTNWWLANILNWVFIIICIGAMAYWLKQLKIFKTALSFIEKTPQFQHFYYRFDVFCFDFHQQFAKNIQQDFSNYSYDHQWIENAFTLDADLINL